MLLSAIIGSKSKCHFFDEEGDCRGKMAPYPMTVVDRSTPHLSKASKTP
jgi:hypothetical protein